MAKLTVKCNKQKNTQLKKTVLFSGIIDLVIDDKNDLYQEINELLATGYKITIELQREIL